MLGFSYRQRISARLLKGCRSSPRNVGAFAGVLFWKARREVDQSAPPGNQPGHLLRQFPSRLKRKTAIGILHPAMRRRKYPPTLGAPPQTPPSPGGIRWGEITPTCCHQDAFQWPSRSLLAYGPQVRPYVRILRPIGCAALLTEPDIHPDQQAQENPRKAGDY